MNFKITTKEDYDIGKLILKESESNMSNIRVGNGFDVHKFKNGQKKTIKKKNKSRSEKKK